MPTDSADRPYELPIRQKSHDCWYEKGGLILPIPHTADRFLAEMAKDVVALAS